MKLKLFKPSIYGVLKALSVSAAICAFYPFAAVKISLCGGMPASVLPELCILALVCLMGCVVGRLTEWYEEGFPILHKIFCGGLSSTVMALSAIILSQLNLAEGSELAADVIYIGVMFAFGIYLHFTEYNRFTYMPILIGVSAAFIVGITALALSRLPYDIVHFSLVLLWIYACFAIICNQSNIDHMMERRRHSLNSLPKKIRFFNIRVLTVIFILIFIAFIFRSYLAAGLVFILRTIGRAIIWVILALAGLIDNTPVEEETPMADDFVLGAEESGSHFLNDLFVVLTFAVILFILIRNRERIFKALRRWWNNLCDMILRLFSATAVRTSHSGSEGYIDTEEYISSSLIGLKKEKRSDIRRLYRKYHRMESGSEKLRLGYGLFSYGVKRMFNGITPDLTPREQCRKLDEIGGQIPCGKLTSDYERVRYADEAFDGDIAELDAAVEAVRRYI